MTVPGTRELTGAKSPAVCALSVRTIPRFSRQYQTPAAAAPTRTSTRTGRTSRLRPRRGSRGGEGRGVSSSGRRSAAHPVLADLRPRWVGTGWGGSTSLVHGAISTGSGAGALARRPRRGCGPAWEIGSGPERPELGQALLVFLTEPSEPPHALVDDPDLRLHEADGPVQQGLPGGRVGRARVGVLDLRPHGLHVQELLDLRQREPEERLEFVDPAELGEIGLGEEPEAPARAARRPEQAQLLVVANGPRGQARPLDRLFHPVQRLGWREDHLSRLRPACSVGHERDLLLDWRGGIVTNPHVSVKSAEIWSVRSKSPRTNDRVSSGPRSGGVPWRCT